MSSPLSVRRFVGASLTLVLAAVCQAQQQPASTPAATIQQAPQAAEPTQEQLKELRTKKLSKPVFEAAAWRADFDAAKKEARQNDQLLLVYFTRSYAY